jgi:hypothetical protein
MEEGPRQDNPATLGALAGRRRSRLRRRQGGERMAAASDHYNSHVLL